MNTSVSQRRQAFAGWAVLALLSAAFGAAGLYYAVFKTVAEGDMLFMHRYLGFIADLDYFSLETQSSWWLYLYYTLNHFLLLLWKCGYEVGQGLFPWTFASLATGIALLAGSWAAYRRARVRYDSPGDLGAFAGVAGLACLVLLSGAWGFRFWVSSKVADLQPADRTLAARYNQTGFDVLKNLAVRPDRPSKSQPPTNTLLSPISLGTALHMIEEGARGETAAELREALHLPAGSGRSVAPGPSRVLQRLRHPEPEHVLQRFVGRASAVDTRLANAGWFDASPSKSMKSAGLLDIEIREGYRRTLEEHFDAAVFLRDFGDGLAEEVNQWAAEKTNGTIRRVIRRSPAEGAVLTNAAYFYGEWSAPFNPEDTESEPFVVPTDGGPVDSTRVPIMHREAEYPYLEQDSLQGVRLPYGETGRLAMYVFMPSDLNRFVRRLSSTRWEALTSGMDSTKIQLGLPKFTLRKSVPLLPTLRQLGVEKAFMREADFGGILSLTSTSDSRADGEAGPLAITRMGQKVYLKVNEKGTEAAAVSFGLFDIGAVPTMKVNRPFYFAIAERQTGAILFHGAIRNPS